MADVFILFCFYLQQYKFTKERENWNGATAQWRENETKLLYHGNNNGSFFSFCHSHKSACWYETINILSIELFHRFIFYSVNGTAKWIFAFHSLFIALAVALTLAFHKRYSFLIEFFERERKKRKNA